MEPNVFIVYFMKGVVSVFNSFGHEQHPSNSKNPWCLITKYPNEGIGFLVGFGMVMQYPCKSQKICSKT
jgi:hypothetical protein